MRPRRPTQSFRFWSLVAALATLIATGAAAVEQSKREVSVVGRKYTYDVADANGPVIRVRLDDLVTVNFSVSDIAHSFTVSDDHYRIDKRAEPGKAVSISFRASDAGEFDIRCTLSIDPRCAKEMRGRLVVTK
jgi:heme/copper-type cytochrome/quinol oxidase subunit 2